MPDATQLKSQGQILVVYTSSLRKVPLVHTPLLAYVRLPALQGSTCVFPLLDFHIISQHVCYTSSLSAALQRYSADMPLEAVNALGTCDHAGGAQKRNPKVPNPAPTAKPANIKLYRGDSGLTGPVVEHLKHPVQPARPLSPFLESLQPDLDQSQLQQPVALQNAPSQPAQHQTSPHVQQSLSQAAPQQPSHLQPTHLVAPPTVGAPPSPPKPAVEIPASLGSPGLVSISPTKVPAMGAPHPRSILPAALSSLGEWLNGKEGVSRGPRATDQQPPAPAVVNLQHAAADVVPALAPAAFSQPLPAVTADQRSPRYALSLLHHLCSFAQQCTLQEASGLIMQ